MSTGMITKMCVGASFGAPYITGFPPCWRSSSKSLPGWVNLRDLRLRRRFDRRSGLERPVCPKQDAEYDLLRFRVDQRRRIDGGGEGHERAAAGPGINGDPCLCHLRLGAGSGLSPSVKAGGHLAVPGKRSRMGAVSWVSSRRRNAMVCLQNSCPAKAAKAAGSDDRIGLDRGIEHGIIGGCRPACATVRNLDRDLVFSTPCMRRAVHSPLANANGSPCRARSR